MAKGEIINGHKVTLKGRDVLVDGVPVAEIVGYKEVYRGRKLGGYEVRKPGGALFGWDSPTPPGLATWGFPKMHDAWRLAVDRIRDGSIPSAASAPQGAETVIASIELSNALGLPVGVPVDPATLMEQVEAHTRPAPDPKK